MFPALDQILAGKYRLIRQLGQGGMGSVWLAEHLALRSPVAIKLIEPSIATNPEALARFLREAQAAAALRSPHVVQILDYGVDAGVPFIAMEVLEGESLAARLARLGRLAPADTIRVMTHVARAISRAHEAGVVHRDLKPDNIYIVHNDEEELAKVLDFGVAKSNLHGLGATGSSATRTGSVLGTPYYMSPEQAEGSKVVDHRSDIWALGVIVWECFLGTRPFESESLGGLVLAICARELPVPSRVGPVPFGFDGWFARACARDPQQRFSTAKEAIGELRRVCGDPTLGPLPAATPPPQGGYPDALRTAAPALAGTTSNLGVVSTRSAGIPSTKLSGALVAAVMLGLLAVATGGTLLLLRSRSAPVAANSAAVATLPPAASQLNA
ncbi:MAG TPA: serine/threonine-protein kinase, partial [Polyangiaceae bacterium]|nr:serine/threonine-protein kinase [Polyangiaceae bacterium]